MKGPHPPLRGTFSRGEKVTTLSPRERVAEGRVRVFLPNRPHPPLRGTFSRGEKAVRILSRRVRELRERTRTSPGTIRSGSRPMVTARDRPRFGPPRHMAGAGYMEREECWSAGQLVSGRGARTVLMFLVVGVSSQLWKRRVGEAFVALRQFSNQFTTLSNFTFSNRSEAAER